MKNLNETNNKGFFHFFLEIKNFPDTPDVLLLQPVDVVLGDYALLRRMVDWVGSAELASPAASPVVVDVAAVVGGARGGGRGVGWGLEKIFFWIIQKNIFLFFYLVVSTVEECGKKFNIP